MPTTTNTTEEPTKITKKLYLPVDNLPKFMLYSHFRGKFIYLGLPKYTPTSKEVVDVSPKYTKTAPF